MDEIDESMVKEVIDEMSRIVMEQEGTDFNIKEYAYKKLGLK